jgi:hypothetical protein
MKNELTKERSMSKRHQMVLTVLEVRNLVDVTLEEMKIEGNCTAWVASKMWKELKWHEVNDRMERIAKERPHNFPPAGMFNK